jgi:transposase
VRELVAARSEMTISELASELGGLGVKVGRSSVYRFLRCLGLTAKKRMARPVRKEFFEVAG